MPTNAPIVILEVLDLISDVQRLSTDRGSFRAMWGRPGHRAAGHSGSFNLANMAFDRSWLVTCGPKHRRKSILFVKSTSLFPDIVCVSWGKQPRNSSGDGTKRWKAKPRSNAGTAWGASAASSSDVRHNLIGSCDGN